MELKQKVGAKIKCFRTGRKLKQAELAELAGIHAKTQSCIETGRNLPSSSVLKKYAQAFDPDIADLLNIYDISKEEDDYYVLLNDLIKKATKKQLKYIYKHAKLIFEQ